jgi:hypothetical protein
MPEGTDPTPVFLFEADLFYLGWKNDVKTLFILK